jgi:hypothetical protein
VLAGMGEGRERDGTRESGKEERERRGTGMEEG